MWVMYAPLVVEFEKLFSETMKETYILDIVLGMRDGNFTLLIDNVEIDMQWACEGLLGCQLDTLGAMPFSVLHGCTLAMLIKLSLF